MRIAKNPTLNDGVTYRLRQARKKHEQMRRDLWCKVYAAAIGDGRYGSAPTLASESLEEFDKRFPNPIGEHNEETT